ncbi:hypothetical protein Agabi119p4_7004 [Agaricus bisporus var. burnettii]|uniref:Uncharacterized protein n=1 Tax=Agaricus bisporus var. burnettii TaxID=192524 RepID=A0A8H7F0M5_AGABI|nr:hypothetical protein Agabi119p4_7004 [Agaricus bisporus var. burnettii]
MMCGVQRADQRIESSSPEAEHAYVYVYFSSTSSCYVLPTQERIERAKNQRGPRQSLEAGLRPVSPGAAQVSRKPTVLFPPPLSAQERIERAV